MTDTPDIPARAVCPENGRTYRAVDVRTVRHQIRRPWNHDVAAEGFYFCDDPRCDVVYFALDGSRFRRADLRQSVGQKSNAADRTLCYCFDITLADVRTDQPGAGKRCREYVVAQTRAGTCDCSIRNPAGRCCLKDFPRDR